MQLIQTHHLRGCATVAVLLVATSPTTWSTGRDLASPIGDPVSQSSGSCSNIGVQHNAAKVIDVGPSICIQSSGVEIEIGTTADGEPVEYSEPTCPEYLLYEPDHNAQTTRVGSQVRKVEDVPQQRQNFYCDTNILYMVCAAEGGPVPQATAVASYSEQTCKNKSAELEQAEIGLAGGLQ